MKKCFVFIVCTVVSLLIQAQNNGSAPGVPTYNYGNSNILASANNSPNRAESKTDTIDNKFYASEMEERFFGGSEFREGELRTRKGLFTTDLSYRFDQLEGTIEVKKQDGTTLLLNEKDILYCKIFYGKTMHTFMPVALPKEKKLTLLHVIYKTPTLQLYRHIHKVIQPYHQSSQYGNPISTGEITTELRNNYRYYIRKGDKDLLQEVNINAKSFIKALPEKEKIITRLFKESKVRGNLTVSAICKMMGKLDKKVQTE
jgi:hypothetical protein